ncbi:MAG TPA: hypothetical protein VH760_02655 [Gaiellaceae bacterium]|jgi:hypothetical protein
MPGFAPRFALEAGFLILLGVGAGYADLRPWVIVAIVAAGWLLVSLIELAVWRAQARPAVVAAPVEDAPEQAADADADADAGAEAPAADDDDREYPLRADAGDAPSEEVEAYTRVIGGGTADDPRSE